VGVRDGKRTGKHSCWECMVLAGLFGIFHSVPLTQREPLTAGPTRTPQNQVTDLGRLVAVTYLASPSPSLPRWSSGRLRPPITAPIYHFHSEVTRTSTISFLHHPGRSPLHQVKCVFSKPKSLLGEHHPGSPGRPGAVALEVSKVEPWPL
jgi:hypothetical protein